MMISVNKLLKKYDGKTVINIWDFYINQPQVVGIVGNNGAGKSTFFRLILDLIKADGGEVFLKGLQTSKHEEWKDFTGAYLDENFLIDYLTAEEFFDFIGSINK